MPSDDLVPSVRKRALPKRVRAARTEADEAFARDAEACAESERRTLQVSRESLDQLVDLHERVGSRYSFEIGADTYWSAFWELSSGILGLADAMLYLLESCFHAQMVPLYRSIHEGTLLLMTFLEPSEEKLVREWLTGKEARPRDSRKALGRAADRMRQAYHEAGVEDEVEDIEDVTRKLYGVLSDPSHLRRSALGDFFDAPTRRAFYRHHADPRQKLHYVEQGLLVIEHVVMVVGACLQQIVGGDFAQDEIAPITGRLGELTGT